MGIYKIQEYIFNISVDIIIEKVQFFIENWKLKNLINMGLDQERTYNTKF